MAIHITADPASDALLTRDPLALLIGMLLDQQVPMETAFSGPQKLRNRLGGFDAALIAGTEPERFVELMRETPAVHRYPGSMGARTQALCQHLLDEWGGDAAAIWTRPNADGSAPDGAGILRRLKALPGFGEQKARIFLALLGKQCGLDAPGWREASAPYGEPGAHRSVADITSPESLALVRAAKKAAKAAAKSER